MGTLPSGGMRAGSKSLGTKTDCASSDEKGVVHAPWAHEMIRAASKLRSKTCALELVMATRRIRYRQVVPRECLVANSRTLRPHWRPMDRLCSNVAKR